MSYGTDQVDIFRQAASYVDRILRGDNPADLPVQAPTKFETPQSQTAKALGLTVPPRPARRRRRGDRMKRREFITLLGGAAVAWPLAARAQQPERMRRIGALINFAEDDVEGQRRLAALRQALQEAGWEIGRNVRIDIRWAGDIEINSKYAMELLAFAPDVFLAGGAATVRALQKATRTVPIVFTSSADPVGAGLVASLARPGGNATGFSSFDYSLGGKWLEFLKQIAPSVTRVAILRDPTYLPESANSPRSRQRRNLGRRNCARSTRATRAEIEQAMSSFTRQPGGGLIVTQNTSVLSHRKLIIGLAASHRLPTV